MNGGGGGGGGGDDDSMIRSTAAGLRELEEVEKIRKQ